MTVIKKWRSLGGNFFRGCHGFKIVLNARPTKNNSKKFQKLLFMSFTPMPVDLGVGICYWITLRRSGNFLTSATEITEN
jgi:hypothetical protein